MKYEVACGAVVYTQINNEIYYVIVQSNEGYYGFPKGHMEANESEEETAIREVREETGLIISLLPGFRYKIEYPLPQKPGVIKQAIYFLATYENQSLTFQKEELSSSELLTYDDALEKLQFANLKAVLVAAHTHINQYHLR